MNNIQNVDITTASAEQLNALVTVLQTIIGQVQVSRTEELQKYTGGTDGFSQRIGNLNTQIEKVQVQIASLQ